MSVRTTRKTQRLKNISTSCSDSFLFSNICDRFADVLVHGDDTVLFVLIRPSASLAIEPGFVNKSALSMLLHVMEDGTAKILTIDEVRSEKQKTYLCSDEDINLHEYILTYGVSGYNLAYKSFY